MNNQIIFPEKLAAYSQTRDAQRRIFCHLNALIKPIGVKMANRQLGTLVKFQWTSNIQKNKENRKSALPPNPQLENNSNFQKARHCLCGPA